MTNSHIDGEEFLEVVRPALSRCDAPALAHAIKTRWRARDVAALLRHENSDVKRLAAMVIGLVGDMSCVGALTRALHDDDWHLNELAENALWSIWFRSGAPAAAKPFCQGVSLMAGEDYDGAIACFEEATRLDPQFAEAYNQCAIARFLLSQWRQCIADSRRAIQLVPCHFGAFGGMGHAFVELGELEKAVQCYRRALRINPRMLPIARALEPLESALRDRRDSSGIYSFNRT
jgi:tetratricopeptide (TPR) repeat protein